MALSLGEIRETRKAVGFSSLSFYRKILRRKGVFGGVVYEVDDDKDDRPTIKGVR